jgi:hypothetical protein
MKTYMPALAIERGVGGLSADHGHEDHKFEQRAVSERWYDLMLGAAFSLSLGVHGMVLFRLVGGSFGVVAKDQHDAVKRIEKAMNWPVDSNQQ